MPKQDGTAPGTERLAISAEPFALDNLPAGSVRQSSVGLEVDAERIAQGAATYKLEFANGGNRGPNGAPVGYAGSGNQTRGPVPVDGDIIGWVCSAYSNNNDDLGFNLTRHRADWSTVTRSDQQPANKDDASPNQTAQSAEDFEPFPVLRGEQLQCTTNNNSNVSRVVYTFILRARLS